MLVPKDNEPARTNTVLLGVSVAAVFLLGPSFILGYFSGYRKALENGPQGPLGAAPAPSQLSTLRSSPAAPGKPNQTAQTIPAGRVRRKESAPAGQADQPAAGQVYLQLVTAAKSRSVAIIATLRNDGFPVVASDVPEKPGLHRVLIGPLHDGEVDKTRADLKSKGFPGDSAIKRTF
ncbi:MAG: hypothetical protein JJE04_02545 [Acidobacteriia bacterium]|nr:hypothetical protein [Terriglobia bacterium]